MTKTARPPCTEQELGWIEAMDVIGYVRAHNLVTGALADRLRSLFKGPKAFPGREQPRNAIELANWDAVADHALHYVRRLPADPDAHYGKVGCAPGNTALISFTEALLIVPAADVDAIIVEAVTPGRSFPFGGCSVSARCAESHAAAANLIDLRFGDEDVAMRLAAKLGVALERTETSGD